MSVPTILIVDDSAPVRLWLRRLLDGQFRTLEAEDCTRAKSLIDNESIDLILLDYALPGKTGLDLCRQIRSKPELKNTPILMVTSDPEDQLISEAFQAGFTDYLRKPIKPVELFARLSQALKHKSIRDQAATLIHELRERSERDPLTCLYNRATLQQLASAEIAQAIRGKTPLGLLMMDVDHFKALNDKYGHLVGDEVLAHLASFLVAQLRQYDIVTRYGGDEFVVLLPNTTLGQAEAVAEKIRTSLHKHPCASDQGIIALSLSIGAACLKPSDKNTTLPHGQMFLSLLHAADKALYNAKEAGRNQVATSHLNPTAFQGG